jgi:hypothetical protein
MARKSKRITRELIRACFGDDARISWVYPWRVRTWSGGEVVITQSTIKTIFGTEDTYRAITLLVAECWGAAVSHGSNEFMLAAVMHGEAAGVPIRPDYGNKHAGLARALAFCFILFIGLSMGAAHSFGALLFTLLFDVAIIAAMANNEKHKKQEKHEQMGFPYPRVYGSAGPARREDAKRRGWI